MYLTLKVNISMCGNFCNLTHQNIFDVEIFALSNIGDFIFYYILYFGKIFGCGYIYFRTDLVKAKLSKFPHHKIYHFYSIL